MNITGKDLQKWGLPAGPVFRVALKVFGENKTRPEVAKSAITGIMAKPECWLDGIYKPIAKALIDKKPKVPRLRDKGVPVKIYGESLIEDGALEQIHTAAKLPISVQAACMPDGHQGYGLPIGGVLATEGAVIPYAVGYDIGCRMHMTILPITEHEARGKDGMFVKTLIDNTVFGKGMKRNSGLTAGAEREVLEDSRFRTIPSLKKGNILATAETQLGTSGAGNHFVEFGFTEIQGYPERRLAILSHSGSRGVGHKIATIYTKLAMEKCKLPGAAKHLAWLSLDEEEGQEYWGAMELAGWYAQSCHRMIHRLLCRALKSNPEMVFENHHNFAWKMDIDDREVVVHRKGATPAERGQIGIIPGSMTTPAYIVSGKGNPESILSSSHGAGRLMSRTAAKNTFTLSQMKKDLQEKGVTLIGGSLDECTFAYKDIDSVMAEQSELVAPIGKFHPWIVRMAEGEEKPWRKK